VPWSSAGLSIAEGRSRRELICRAAIVTSSSFAFDEYWKGSPGRAVLVYGLDPGTDCLGDGYQVDKEYLVYASESAAKDYSLAGRLWYGWTDVLPEGAPMLVPRYCPQTWRGVSRRAKGVARTGQGTGSQKTVSLAPGDVATS